MDSIWFKLRITSNIPWFKRNLRKQIDDSSSNPIRIEIYSEISIGSMQEYATMCCVILD